MNRELTRPPHLATQLGKAGRVDEAISQFQSLLADTTRILGPDHPDTLSNRKDLDSLLADRGEPSSSPFPAELISDPRWAARSPTHCQNGASSTVSFA